MVNSLRSVRNGGFRRIAWIVVAASIGGAPVGCVTEDDGGTAVGPITNGQVASGTGSAVEKPSPAVENGDNGSSSGGPQNIGPSPGEPSPATDEPLLPPSIIGPAPDAPSALDVAAVRQQLGDRFFETGTSSGNGTDSITGVLRLALCGFGAARISETTIFAGGTPTEFLDFSSDTVVDGVWDVAIEGGEIVLVVRDAVAGAPDAASAPVLRRFAIDLDASGVVVAIDGRPIRSSESLAADCASLRARQEALGNAALALTNRRITIAEGDVQGTLVLCGSGNYGFVVVENGGLAILEGGRWGLELADGGVTLVLRSDPQFDPNGQTFRTTLAVSIGPAGVQVGVGANTVAAVTGDCDAAIQQLLANGG